MEYNKTVWITGDIITEKGINNIEDGIEALYGEVNKLDEFKAEIDGYYEGISAGSSEQLLASTPIFDNRPYLYRKTGGGIPTGNRKTVESIIGGTVVWNQLNNNNGETTTTEGITVTNNEDGSWTITGESYGDYPSTAVTLATDINLTGNHIFYITPGIANDGEKDVWGNSWWLQINGTYSVDKVLYSFSDNNIKKMDAYGDLKIFFSQYFKAPENGLVIKPQIFDLTLMFGDKIAEAILAMDITKVGNGVKWFRSLFPTKYYPYNSGELMHVELEGHATLGTNLWDGQWTQGDIDNEGHDIQSNTMWCSLKTQVIPGEKYLILDSEENTPEINCYYYDYDDNFIGHGLIGETVPENAPIMKFTASEEDYPDHDLCLTFKVTDGEAEYEEYSLHYYDFTNSQGTLTQPLRGIPSWDSAEGKMYYDGDEYKPDGSIVRHYGLVDLGTLNWDFCANDQTYWGDKLYGDMSFYASISDIKIISIKEVPRVRNAFDLTPVSMQYISETLGVGTDPGIDIIAISSENHTIAIRKSRFSEYSTDQVKSELSGVYLLYELDEPTTESNALPAYSASQTVNQYGVEYFVDIALDSGREVEIPAAMNAYYWPNLRDKLQLLPNPAWSNGVYMISQNDWTQTYVSPTETVLSIIENAPNDTNRLVIPLTGEFSYGGEIVPQNAYEYIAYKDVYTNQIVYAWEEMPIQSYPSQEGTYRLSVTKDSATRRPVYDWVKDET